jgi:hypothetical protein
VPTNNGKGLVGDPSSLTYCELFKVKNDVVPKINLKISR